MTKRIDYVCKHCGSNELIFDATARWDEDFQEWALSDTFEDKPYCGNCDIEVNYVAKDLPPITENQP